MGYNFDVIILRYEHNYMGVIPYPYPITLKKTVVILPQKNGVRQDNSQDDPINRGICFMAQINSSVFAPGTSGLP